MEEYGKGKKQYKCVYKVLSPQTQNRMEFWQ